MPAAATPTPVFTNAAGALLTHPAGYAILRYADGSWAAADLAALLTNLGELMLRHGWAHCLADARQMPPLSAESKAWLEANWLGPTAARPQPLHIALVQAADVFTRLSIAQMQAQNHGNTYYTYFNSEEEAHVFLLTQLGREKRR